MSNKSSVVVKSLGIGMLLSVIAWFVPLNPVEVFAEKDPIWADARCLCYACQDFAHFPCAGMDCPEGYMAFDGYCGYSNASCIGQYAQWLDCIAEGCEFCEEQIH